MKSLRVSPIDKDTVTKKSSVIYLFRCNKNECEDEYRGEHALYIVTSDSFNTKQAKVCPKRRLQNWNPDEAKLN